MGSLVFLLGLEPVGEGGGTTLAGLGGILAFNLDGHVLVLLQVAGEVRLFGGGGGLGHGEGLDVAISVGLLDGGGLISPDLLQVEILDEVGYEERAMLAT